MVRSVVLVSHTLLLGAHHSLVSLCVWCSPAGHMMVWGLALAVMFVDGPKVLLAISPKVLTIVD